MTDEKWEILDQVPGPSQAEILRGLLEAQEIPVILLQEGVGRAVGFTVGPLGEVQMLVPSSEMERALQILEDYYAGRLVDRDSSEVQDEMEEE